MYGGADAPPKAEWAPLTNANSRKMLFIDYTKERYRALVFTDRGRFIADFRDEGFDSDVYKTALEDQVRQHATTADQVLVAKRELDDDWNPDFDTRVSIELEALDYRGDSAVKQRVEHYIRHLDPGSYLIKVDSLQGLFKALAALVLDDMQHLFDRRDEYGVWHNAIEGLRSYGKNTGVYEGIRPFLNAPVKKPGNNGNNGTNGNNGNNSGRGQGRGQGRGLGRGRGRGQQVFYVYGGGVPDWAAYP